MVPCATDAFVGREFEMLKDFESKYAVYSSGIQQRYTAAAMVVEEKRPDYKNDKKFTELNGLFK